jgi:hypothetical protein
MIAQVAILSSFQRHIMAIFNDSSSPPARNRSVQTDRAHARDEQCNRQERAHLDVGRPIRLDM